VRAISALHTLRTFAAEIEVALQCHGDIARVKLTAVAETIKIGTGDEGGARTKETIIDTFPW
jgi:hypothetical protein